MSNQPVGKLLPNINVTVDDISDDIVSSTYASSLEPSCTIVRPSIEPFFQIPKVYKSKDEGFATGIDLFSEENEENLSKRAVRFGLKYEESAKESMKSLYQSLGITTENKNSGCLKHVRLDAIHVRGVNELSTAQVKSYFEMYGPRDIEWINDISCNVVFSDEASCARALLGMSSIIDPTLYSKVKSLTHSKETSEISVQNDEEYMEVDPPSPAINIPVPPGDWRQGKPHPSGHTLLLRFATTGDKKLPGAEKFSVYYQKHGNPNYQGLTGLISESQKQKQHSDNNKRDFSKVVKNSKAFPNKQAGAASSSKIKPRFSRSVVLNRSEKSKPFKIRSFMYADEEERQLKLKKARANRRVENVHSRLGKKYTSDELQSLGPFKVSSDSDIEESRYDAYATSENGAQTDLREKLEKIRSNTYSSKTAIKKYHRHGESSRDYRNGRLLSDSANGKSGDFGKSIAKSSRVEELKKESSKSYFKRKHRSPLMEDEDDDEDSDYTDSS